MPTHKIIYMAHATTHVHTRLPKSRFVLYTIRRAADPMRELERWPAAAAALGASLRRKFKGSLAKMELGLQENAQPILDYIDGCAVRGGLAPGRVPGVEEELWDREAIVDGTTAPSLDRAQRRRRQSYRQ